MHAMSDFECVRGNAWVNLIDVFSSHIPQDTFPAIAFELLVHCWYTWLYSCTQYIYMFQFVSMLESLQKNDNFDFQSLILIACTPWNLECEFQSCLKCLYVLNLEMTTYGLKTYETKYQISNHPEPPDHFRHSFALKEPPSSKILMWHSLRHKVSGPQGGGAKMEWSWWVDGFWMMRVPFKETSAILSELLIINVWNRPIFVLV